MFSGIIAARGTVLHAISLPEGGMRLRLRCDGASDADLEPKDSVAISGVCLTATSVDHNVVEFDVVPETLARSTLRSLREADTVNVEYALIAGDPIGGHFVYGHVDASASVLWRRPEGNGQRMRIELPRQLRPYIVEKAFVDVDGVSVTVAACAEYLLEVALVPEPL